MKKIILLIAFFAAWVSCSYAQLLGSIKIQPNDMIELSNARDSAVSRIIEKTVRPGLFVIKRSFQLQDKKSKELFGLNGRPEFGIGYSIGIKTPNGFCLTDQAISPWNYNDAFKKYQGKYIPIISKSEYAELSKDSILGDTFDLTNKCTILCDSSIYRYESDIFNGNSFKIDSLAGEKKGWLIWLTAQKNADLNNFSNLEFLCQEKVMLVDRSISSDSLGDIPSDVQILGGVYVIPIFKGIGKLELHLCGVLSKTNNQWRVCFPFFMKNDGRNVTETEKTEEKPEEMDELTPIEKKSKSKKKK